MDFRYFIIGAVIILMLGLSIFYGAKILRSKNSTDLFESTQNRLHDAVPDY